MSEMCHMLAYKAHRSNRSGERSSRCFLKIMRVFRTPREVSCKQPAGPRDEDLAGGIIPSQLLSESFRYIFLGSGYRHLRYPEILCDLRLRFVLDESLSENVSVCVAHAVQDPG